MKCLDSDFLISLLRGEKDALSSLDKLKKEEIAITSINAFELFVGAFISKRSENIAIVSKLVDSYIFLNFNKEAAKLAGEIVVDLEKKGEKIDWRDCMIAAVAVVNGCVLVTRNKRHFSKIKGLEIQEW